MKIIFCDTTLTSEDIPLNLRKNICFFPAIMRGDIIRLLRTSPEIEEIIIVDGVFDQAPSITHKEILYAIERNVKVVGISSMGALRGAELFQFGMLGAGEIFKSYLDGVLLSDDEVAVSYVQRKGEIYKTIPLINVRKTVEKNHLDEGILKKAQQVFYKQRNWERLKKILSNEEYSLLKNNYIDQKKQDVINYLTTGNHYKYHQSTGRKEVHYRSIYFNKELVTITNNGLINFIRNSLFDKEIGKSSSFEKNISLCCNIARFINIDERYGSVIQKYLREWTDVYIDPTHIFHFNRSILKELNIKNKNNLLNYLTELNINTDSLHEVFSGLYKLYLCLMHE